MSWINRILLSAAMAAVLLLSWFVVASMRPEDDRQLELIAQADAYIADEIYIRAIPLLQEAAGFNTQHTPAAETRLKMVYLAMIERRGYARSYIELLEHQMGRKDAPPEVFFEAAYYYLDRSNLRDALDVLKRGAARTGDPGLIELYEQHRYAYTLSYNAYENVTAMNGGMISVQNAGLWGIADPRGQLMIPCEYEKISTYSADRAIVQKNGVVYAVNLDNNRLALLKEEALDFGNLGSNRVPILTREGWKRASGELIMGSMVFEEIGMYTLGYVAAKQDGRWGVIDTDAGWLVPPEYDAIIMDELGRCFGQGNIFAVQGGQVYLFINGERQDEVFEDAMPFAAAEGYAAVKKNGLWGFIDATGTLRIDYSFEDALSFGQHLAAVRVGELWGYVSVSGNMAIEPAFPQAKSFSGGCAPVFTDRGWQFIMLVE